MKRFHNTCSTDRTKRGLCFREWSIPGISSLSLLTCNISSPLGTAFLYLASFIGVPQPVSCFKENEFRGLKTVDSAALAEFLNTRDCDEMITSLHLLLVMRMMTTALCSAPLCSRIEGLM